jgi:Amylo-alpha-1,6-glucosidase
MGMAVGLLPTGLFIFRFEIRRGPRGQRISSFSYSVLRVVCQDLSVTLHYIYGVLRGPRAYIRDDAWAGLPELTNKDGAVCHDSCPTQAWSASTLLDVLEEINELS